MKIPVVWLSLNPDTPPRGYWDQGMIEAMFSHEMYRPTCAYDFVHIEGSFIPKKYGDNDIDGAVIVFPARAQVDYIDKLNEQIASLKWVVLLLTGDEEAVFPVEKIKHNNIRTYVMSPREGRHEAYRKLGTGYPPQAREFIPKNKHAALERKYDYFFAGQITHERRQKMKQQLETIVEFNSNNKLNGFAHFSQGFTQGLEPAQYYRFLAGAKIAPAPSGPETPDSFRLFEALEAGCIPIADTRSPKGGFSDTYWEWFFGGPVPFPVLTDYEQLQGFMMEARDNWKPLSNKIFAWWQAQKRAMCYQLHDDISELTGYKYRTKKDARDHITVIIPTSVIPAHPDTTIIEETVAAVREQLPFSEIIISFDGIREQQKDRTADYQEYIRRVLWLCNNQWSNVLPVVFEEHMHQASMAREVLKLVKTPTILYVEHDAPVTPDRFIDWTGLVYEVAAGTANVIRLLHEELILPDYAHMMYDTKPQVLAGKVPMVRTSQWSQRPHLASTAFYRTMIDTYFNPDSKTMIEDVMHGVVHSFCEREGEMGWNQWRLWIYCPDSDSLGIKRSYHTDGRGADPKFDMIIKPVSKGN